MVPDKRGHVTTNSTCNQLICFSGDLYGDRGEKSTCLKIEVTGQILKTD